MKGFILIVLTIVLTGCGATRALVKDCKDAGDGFENCEVVKIIK